MKNIFEAVELNNLHLKNRLVRSATWEGIAAQDGSIGDDTYEIYRDPLQGGRARLCRYGYRAEGNAAARYHRVKCSGKQARSRSR